MVTNVSETSWFEIERWLPSYGRLNANRVNADTDMFLAVDHDGNRHALLFLGNTEEAFADERSRGLTVHGRQLEVEGEAERLFLDITCTDRNGKDAFNLVVSEILRHLMAGTEPINAVKITLARWRRFWGSAPGNGLSSDEVLGLFGELWFMLVWLAPYGLTNICRWVGPLGGRNDFQWPGFSIEVKTTGSIRGHIHRINGLDQLDPPEGGELFLFSLRVREEATSSNSLTALIERIGNLLISEPELMELFEDRLARAGYSPVHAERYSQTRFRVVGERLYRVSVGFPRLSVASFCDGLPRGVERVEYEINLETCPELYIGRSPGEPGVNLEP